MDINLTAVGLATIAYVLVGFIWWTPQVFGKNWLALMGWSKKSKKDLEKMKKESKGAMLSSFVSAGVTSYILAYFLKSGGITDVSGAITMVAVLWLGFTAMGSIVDYSYAKRPVRLWAINYGYHLVGMVVAAAVIMQF